MQDLLMQDYLIRALQDDIGDLNLINVIRVLTGKSVIEKGVSGYEHHSSVKKRAKELRIQIDDLDDEEDFVKDEEDVEIDEILSSYLKKE